MKFALAGNPNSGKTTLFNSLTGSSAHVGNWPGVTIDKKVGYYKKLEEKIEIIDLPGIYSLSPYSPEEVVSRKYILEEKPDAIINIVDATNLERNLYLTTQLMEIDLPIIVALNMSDVLQKEGDKIDLEALQKSLELPVVQISALRGNNIHTLMEKAYMTAKNSRKGFSVLSKTQNIKELYNKIYSIYNEKKIENAVFHTVKMIEEDELEVKNNPDISKIANELKKKEEPDEFEGDYETKVADIRYKYITSQYAAALKKAKRANYLTKSDKIDKVLTHRFWGIPIFMAIMLAIFHFIFSSNFLFLSLYGVEPISSPGVFLLERVEIFVEWSIGSVEGAMANAPEWITGLIAGGLMSGLGAIVSFLPQILLLFLFLSILEDSGYMARVAFIMDRAFRKFGLSGKAFLPLLMCFGCAVPGIMATRSLENDKERRLSILLAPFFSCGAKLPIWATFAATVFLGRGGEFIVFGMYFLGIAVAILAAIIMKKTFLKGEVPVFIMELPAYRLPQGKNTVRLLWNKLKHYIVKAGTIIAGAIVVIWFLSSFSFTFQYVNGGDNSILSIIGKGLRWLFIPLGFGMGSQGWKFVVAVLTGLIAKEMVVGTLGVFGGMDGDSVIDMEGEALAGTGIAALLGVLSIPAALSFMAFNLLSVPCMAAVAAAHGELGSKKKTFGAIGFWLTTAYIVSAAIYWIGAIWWISLILAAIIAITLITLWLVKKTSKKGVAPCKR